VNGKVSEGQRYICSNPQCHCEIEVRVAPCSETTTNPYCVCGSPMRRPYQKPTVTQLSPNEAKALLSKAELP
jgi:hypothetical protein